MTPQVREHGAQVEPSLGGLERCTAHRQEIDRVLETAPGGVVIAGGRHDRRLGGENRGPQWPGPGSGGDLLELVERFSGLPVLAERTVGPDDDLETGAPLGSVSVGEGSQEPLGELRRLTRAVPVESDRRPAQQREWLPFASGEELLCLIQASLATAQLGQPHQGVADEWRTRRRQALGR